MHNILTIIFLLMIVGCSSTISKTEIKVEKETEAKVKDMRPYCEQLSDIAASATILKWTSRNMAVNSDKVDWRFLAVIKGESLENLGLTEEQIKVFSQEIFNTDLVSDIRYDSLSYKYYTQQKCEMSLVGEEPKPINELQSSIDKCWGNSQKLDTKICISKVVSGEIEL